MLASAALLALSGGCAGHRNPALAVVNWFEPLDGGRDHVSPYFANLYALSLVRHGLGAGEVRDYVAWYLDHLNYPDRHGLTGTIDDMDVRPGGRLERTGRYDSVDGYAGTFLLLLDEWEQSGGDRALLEANRARIQDVAWLLLRLQDPDGLVRALPDANARYLMDNCEAYAGLLAYDALSRRLGWDTGPRHRIAAEDVREAVLGRLSDEPGRRFHWADAGGVPHRSDWDVFYPDALAQLFPILYGVVDARSDLAQHLWREFGQRHDPRAGRPVSAVQRAIIDLTRERVTP